MTNEVSAKRIVEQCLAAASLDADERVEFILDALKGGGYLRDVAAPSERDMLTSTIRWSTDFTKGPTFERSNQAYLVLRWCSEFRMECTVYRGNDAFDVFLSSSRKRRLPEDAEVLEARRPDEFAWAEIVDWPPAAHEAIAAKLQAEADRFARQAEEARGRVA